MTASLPTVFVVDDDAPVRKSLMRLLKSAGYRTESFSSADEFLDGWKANPVPGCVLLDIMMPGLDGLQLQQALRASALEIPIIFITGHGDIPLSVKAIKAGAIDFFPKPIDDQKLLRAVDEALQRDALVRTERAARDIVSYRYATLTPREREVLALVVRGMLNKQIASALGASEKTIKIHRGRVMEKMKVNSVADLVRAAETIGLGPDTALSPS
ncbi:MAG: DNA-binding response regulator [Desulfobacteraceae bacterium]|nr:MAG: DNA-binding response regulator [Desulfobacteraceae bacterium]